MVIEKRDRFIERIIDVLQPRDPVSCANQLSSLSDSELTRKHELYVSFQQYAS
jgi:hypothetical protein